MPDTDSDELQALAKIPGALKIITSEHACGAGKHPTMPPFDEAMCKAYRYPLTDPRHMVIHDVVRLKKVIRPDGRERWQAFSAEGDYIWPAPAGALLRRLQEWRTETR